MDGYEVLRARAAQKLDQAIQAARKEYRETVAKIYALRAELGDEPPVKGLKVRRTCFDAARHYAPQDRPFSTAELMEILGASEPEAHYTRSAVKSALCKMADRQELQRIAKDGQGHILYATAEHAVEVKPYATMAMSDVIAEVLEGSEPMRPAEIVVAVQRLGCRSEDDPSYLLRVVRKALYANPRRFTAVEGKRWALTADSRK